MCLRCQRELHTSAGRLTTTHHIIKGEMQVDSSPPPEALRDATYCGVARLSCQAGGVASDEAVLFIQPAGTLQDAAQSQTERNVTPLSSSGEGAEPAQAGAWARPAQAAAKRARRSSNVARDFK